MIIPRLLYNPVHIPAILIVWVIAFVPIYESSAESKRVLTMLTSNPSLEVSSESDEVKKPFMQYSGGMFYHFEDKEPGFMVEVVVYKQILHQVYGLRYRGQHLNPYKRFNDEFSLLGGLRYYSSFPDNIQNTIHHYWQVQLGFITLHDRDYIRPVYEKNVVRFAGSLRISYGMHLRITNEWLVNFELPLEFGHAAGYPEPPDERNRDITRSYNFVTFLPAISIIYRMY